jgi:hypothetical protein
MNSRTTLWLMAVALGLFGYIYFVELRQSDSGERAQQSAKLLPNFDPSKVTAIEITQSNGVVRAELTRDEWELTMPPYPAQSTGIEALLNALAGLKRDGEITAQEIIAQSGGLSPFGLDPARANLRIQESTNVVQLRVGAKTLVGNRVYVQPAGAPGIFMVDASFLQYLPATPNQWRNPLLIQSRTLAFDHISITTGARTFKLEHDRTNQVWRLTEPMQTRADLGRVQYLIQQLANTRVSQFVTDDPKDDVDGFGLQPPEAELTLALGTNPVFQMQFGKNPTNDLNDVYARLLRHTNVILVPRDLADLVKQHYTEFRDRTLISFRPASVDRIEVRADESFAVQRASSNDWQIVEPFHAPADRELMDFFLNGLGKLEIISFEKDAVADFAPYGLTPKPQRQYVLKSFLASGNTLTNQTLVEAEFGASPTNDLGQPELDRIYCRRSDENSVYVVPLRDAMVLPGAAFLLRDRKIWHYASSNVVGVTVLQRGQKRQWLRDPATRAWVKNDPIANAALDETLQRLGDLQADVWWRRGNEFARYYGTSPSQFQILIDLKEAGVTRELKLSFGKLASSGQPFAAVVLEQGEPVIFKFPVQVYEWVAKYLSIPAAETNP